jgi:penicillin-binding protein 1A
MLANGGRRLTPTLIDTVQDRNGMTIYRADKRPCPACSNIEWQKQAPPVIPVTGEQIADPGSTFQIVEMMEGVVERGTATVVKAVGRPIAGKTGTTNDFHDAWFVGFTPDLAAGVFMGYDDPISLGEGETGGHLSAPIFRDFMLAALKDKPVTDFRIPPGMRMYRVNPATALQAGSGEPAVMMAYKPGTEPGQNRELGLQGVPGEEAGTLGTPDLGEPNGRQPNVGTGGLY